MICWPRSNSTARPEPLVNELIQGFVLGLGNIVNPCVLPLYPAFLAYLAANQTALERTQASRWLGAIVLAGVLTMMLIIGLILAILQAGVGAALAVVLPIVYLLVIGMGVLMLLGINPFARLPVAHVPRLKNPAVSAYLYGMLYGPMTLPCCGPLVVGVFAVGAANVGSVLDGVGYFLAFGLGFGLPLVILPWLAEPVRKAALHKLLAHHLLLERLAGVLLIAIGLFGIANDWDLLRAYFAYLHPGF